MNLFSGIMYNLRGLWLGVRTPRLLLLGFLRFAVVAMLTVVVSGLILAKHADILALLWQQPQSPWVVWIWHLASWLLTLLLMGISAVAAYLLAQVLFAVFIMDLMSRITQRLVTGTAPASPTASIPAQMGFLIRQELPRNIIPVLLTLVIMALGWLTPLGPVLTVVGPMVAAIFLAWDNTDLIPARNLQPFGRRFKALAKTPLFHLGFGLPFLVPVLNLLFLSFAPVGATLYHIDREKKAAASVQAMKMRYTNVFKTKWFNLIALTVLIRIMPAVPG
jgi:CysZ protein